MTCKGEREVITIACGLISTKTLRNGYSYVGVGQNIGMVTILLHGAVVVVERSLPSPEVCGSNPVTAKLKFECLLSTVLKDEKRGRECPI